MSCFSNGSRLFGSNTRLFPKVTPPSLYFARFTEILDVHWTFQLHPRIPHFHLSTTSHFLHSQWCPLNTSVCFWGKRRIEIFTKLIDWGFVLSMQPIKMEPRDMVHQGWELPRKPCGWGVLTQNQAGNYLAKTNIFFQFWSWIVYSEASVAYFKNWPSVDVKASHRLNAVLCGITKAVCRLHYHVC